MLIDSHCHLDCFCGPGELDAMLERAKAAGVDAMITVGTSISDWAVYAKMAAAHPGIIHWTAGLHPTEIDEDWKDQLASLASWFATAPCPIGIGEVGLDYYHLPKDKAKAAPIIERQKAAFTAQLEIALQLDCPLVVHSRNAFADTLAMIGKSGIDWRKVVYHCFSEGPAEIRALNERGGRGSFTGVVTYKNAGRTLEAAIAQGPELLMLETDCPWLTPEPLRGRRNEPALLPLTLQCLASAMNLPVKELEMRAEHATRSFFGI